MFYLDTESIGLYGPTVLIQWAIDDGPIQIHNIFKEPVYKTLRLIELMCEHTVVGYNLAHDSFHINRTYGVLKQLPMSLVPTALNIHDFENDAVCHDEYCVKPKHCIDFLILGKKGPFQSVMKQKPIVLKKVPKVIAEEVLEKLKSTVEIPDIYFKGNKTIRGANWKIVDIDDEDFINIKLAFNPKAALKNIIEHITGNEALTIEDLPQFKKAEEYEYFPTLGTWLDVAEEHIWGWSNNPTRLKYAKDDVEYLRILRKYFEEKGVDIISVDSDSELAWAVGANFWRGFAVDLPRIKKLYDKVDYELNKYSDIKFNSSQWTLKYLHESCSVTERKGFKNTRIETLRNIADDKDFQEGNSELVKKCNLIIKLRHLYKERDLYQKLITAKRLYVQFKVMGTKSNRMSGGSESFITSKGSISPQGIQNDPEVRSCFPLAHNDMQLSGGDFDSFEVSIAEAEYNDPELRQDLLKGKKIHALLAEAMYENVSYDEIIKYKKISEDEPLGYYARGKRAFFARLYGALIDLLCKILWLTEDQVWKGLKYFFTKYKGVKESQDKTYADHQALIQEGGIGTRIVWKEPKEYVESFLGFKRYFRLEYDICKTLFDMAQNLKVSSRMKVVRRDRMQTAGGATRSAIYAAAFNIQSQIMRSAVNHKIQSPGGQTTKNLQWELWDTFQPFGCQKWHIMLFNVHDELMVAHLEELGQKIEKVVNSFIEKMKNKIPLIAMEWKINLKHWGEK